MNTRTTLTHIHTHTHTPSHGEILLDLQFVLGKGGKFVLNAQAIEQYTMILMFYYNKKKKG